MSDDLTQSRCPDAYTILAFGVGALIGAAAVLGRCFIPAWYMQRRRTRP